MEKTYNYSTGSVPTGTIEATLGAASTDKSDLKVAGLEGYDIITWDDISSNELLNKELIARFKQRYLPDGDFILKKRKFFKTLRQQYTDPSCYPEAKIKIHTLHTYIKAFMAAYLDADLSVVFSEDQSIDEEIAYMFEVACKYDYDVMNKQQKDYLNLFHALLYGVGIRAKVGYNKQKKVPEFVQVHPDSWIPDREGNVIDNNFSYHIFEMYNSRYDLKVLNAGNEGMYNYLDKITNASFVYDDSREQERKRARLLQTARDKTTRLRLLQIMCTINGRKYIATVANNCSLIIRREIIPALVQEEVDNPYLIQFPVAITNVFPLQDDPFGLGYGEIIMNPQVAINILMNLALFKEQRNAGFANYIVDTSKITNIDLLATRSEDGPVFIPAKSRDGSGIANAIMPVQEERLDGNTVSMVDKIDMLVQNETSMTAQSRGQNPANGTTLGQSQMQQGNSNVLFLLDYTCLSRGEIQFVKNIRFRCMLEYLTNDDEKIYRLTNGFGAPKIKLTKSIFKKYYDPYIKIMSKRIESEKNKQKIAYLVQKQTQMAMMPGTPQVSTRLIAREVDRLNGMSRELIYLANPLTKDEMRAQDYCKMINAGEKPKNLFSPGMDLFTYYVYISYCDDSQLKRDIMMQIETLMTQEQMEAPQQMPTEMPSDMGANMGASNSAQMTSNFISSMNKDNKQPTIADVSR